MLDGLTRVLLSSLTSNPACRYGVIKRTGIAQHCASRLECMAILVYELKLAPCYAPVRNVTGEVYHNPLLITTDKVFRPDCTMITGNGIALAREQLV